MPLGDPGRAPECGQDVRVHEAPVLVEKHEGMCSEMGRELRDLLALQSSSAEGTDRTFGAC